MRFRFTVTLKEQIDVQKPDEQVTEQVTEQVKSVLSCLKDGELRTAEMLQSLGLHHRPTFMYDYLQPALNAGLIEMTHPDSPRSPKQKYRLTREGMQISGTISLSEQIDVRKPDEQVAEQVTEQVKSVLSCLKDGELRTAEMLQSLGLHHRPTFMYDYLQPALNAGLIEMTHPDSPRSPKQKYRLTREGNTFLSKQ